MKIAITGAAGGIGRSLMRVLGERHEVVGIIRSSPPAEAGTYVRSADAAALAEALAGADCVVHNALDRRAGRKAFVAANTALTGEILSGAVGGRCRLFVYVSSQAVYATSLPRHPGGYREDLPLAAEGGDDYVRLKVEGERLVEEACRTAGIPALIVRPTVVMGPGLDWSDGIARSLRFFVVGVRGRILNVIAVDDVSRFVRALIERGEGGIYNLGAANVPSETYFDALAASLGRRAHYLPGWLLRAAAPLIPPTVWFFRTPVAIDCDKVVAATGITPERRVETMFRPRPRVLAPARLEELQGIVRSGRPFVAHGRGYVRWFNAAGSADIVSMANYHGVVGLDGARVTARAGTRLSELLAFLDARGLTLATLPEFSGLSVGACFFVDVHGSDASHFSTYDLIEEIRYLDENGNEVISPRDESLWAELRRRTANFILTAVSFRTEPAGYLSNRVEWRPDTDLETIMDGAYRDNLSTTIQWYPRHRKMLVYNINPVAGPVSGAARSMAPFRGLHYVPQRALVALALRGPGLLVDRASAILSPWKRVPLEPLVAWLLRHRIVHARDLEIRIRLADGIRLVTALRDGIARGAIALPRGQGIGVRFGYDRRTGEHFVWIEFVCFSAAAADRFIALARALSTSDLAFHGGKYRPQ